MMRSLKFSHPWRAFIPFGGVLMMGRIADLRCDWTSNKKVSFSLFFLKLFSDLSFISVATVALASVVNRHSSVIVAFVAVFFNSQELADKANYQSFLFGILLIIGYLLLIVCAILKMIYNDKLKTSMYRILSILDPEKVSDEYYAYTILFGFSYSLSLLRLSGRAPQNLRQLKK